MRFLKALSFAAVAGLMAVGASSARADSIKITLQGGSPTMLGVNDFLYVYNVSLDQNAQVQATNSWLTIYDIAGLIPGTSGHSDPNWATAVQENTTSAGNTPFAQNPTDSPSLPNLRWVWTGANTPTLIVGAPTPLGTFSFESTIGTPVVNGLIYSAQDKDSQSGDPLNPQLTTGGNTNAVTGPSAVPVPASAWSGLVLLAALGLRRLTARVSA